MEDTDMGMAFFLVAALFGGLVLIGRSSISEETSKAQEACVKAGGEFLAIQGQAVCFAPGVLIKK